MSWKASGYVKTLYEGAHGEPITRSEKLLLLILADYYNDSLHCAWPKVSDLAEQAMVSSRRIRQLLHSCSKKGLISIARRFLENGSPDVNEIRFPGLVPPEKPFRRGTEENFRRGTETDFRRGTEKISAPSGNPPQGPTEEDFSTLLKSGDSAIKEITAIEPPCEPPEGETRARPRETDTRALGLPNGFIDHAVIVAYWTRFRDVEIPAPETQQRAIAKVTDLKRWEQVLDYWQDNGFRAKSLGKMIDTYLEGGPARPRGKITRNELLPGLASGQDCPRCHGKGWFVDPLADWMGQQVCPHVRPI